MNGAAGLERLLPHHLAMLRDGSALADELILEREYFSVTAFAEVRRLGFSERQCLVPGLVIPLRNVDGQPAGYQLRPDTPRVGTDGKVIKYETPKNSRVVLDVPRRCVASLRDPSIPLYVTEGSKKADALAGQNLTAIAISGVWNWRGTNELGGKMVLPDWDLIALNERLVRLVFDSDASRKRSVALGLLRLKNFLELRGAVCEVVYLPNGPDGSKQGVDDFFAGGGAVADFKVLIRPEILLPRDEEADGLPEIVVNSRHLKDVTDDCWQVIAKENDRSPLLFQREGRMVRVVKLTSGARIEEIDPDSLRFVLERKARFVRIGNEDSGCARYPDRLQADVAADILVTWSKPLPQLRGVVRTPVVSTSGTVSVTPGYQPEAELFYDARADAVPAIPPDIGAMEVEDARNFLFEWLTDFPFVGAASRANALAMVLTYVARELIDGPTPLFVIGAPTQGTGKGLLAQTAGVVMEGADPGVVTEAKDGEEWRKRITAQLTEGAGVILIDNVKRRLVSAELCAVLTTTSWSDRLLGVNRTVTVPNRAVWIVTGNNIQLDPEVGRRSVSIRLDARMDRPWEGRSFRHPDLLEWVREQRPRLVHSLLTLTLHWLRNGRPPHRGAVLGSFESWCRVVGGILNNAGIEGFLENRHELYRLADAETEEWRAFTIAWWQRFEDDRVRAADLAELMREEDLLPGLVAAIRGDGSLQQIKIRLGKALTERTDRRIGDYFIRFHGHDRHKKGNVYSLGLAEGDALPDAPSADSPQKGGPDSDSVAGSAESAESNSNPCAGASGTGRGEQDRGQPGGPGAGDNPPNSPHAPQLGSELTPGGAESAAESASSANHPPQAGRCRDCGLKLSVVALGDQCGRCRRGS